MQTIFILTALAGTAYFASARRCVDYFTLAFFSAAVYFLPGFLGATSFHVEGIWSDTPIHPEAYGVMITVLFSIVLSALVADRFAPRVPLRLRIPGEAVAVWFVAAAALAGLAGVALTAGRQLLDPDKVSVMKALGRWDILFYSAAVVGFPVAVWKRQTLLASCFMLLLLVELYVGSRSPIAIAMLAALLLVLHDEGGPQRLVRRWRYVALVIPFGFVLFAYKQIAFAVKSGRWDLVVQQLTNAESYAFFVTHSEPFATQQILNDVIAQRFHTGADHILSTLYQLIIFAPELGANAVAFNDYFQPALFPEVDYGLAANIWAQMWSAGGWPLLIAFVVVFNLGLLLGNVSLRLSSPFLRAGLAPAFVYWAFYLHRNDLGYQINLEKRVLLIVVAAAIVAIIASRATRPAMATGARDGR